jgi:predicted ATPase
MSRYWQRDKLASKAWKINTIRKIHMLARLRFTREIRAVTGDNGSCGKMMPSAALT